MIDPRKLNAVETIVVHGTSADERCADGTAAALLLLDALPGRRLVWVQYKMPSLRDLRAERGMLFADMTPPADRVEEFVRGGAIVLDHHRGARRIVEAFGEDGVFADEAVEPGVSGAMLAFREVWEPRRKDVAQNGGWWEEAVELATLAGIRDTWQKKHPRWRDACAQAAALCFWPFNRLVSAGICELGDSMIPIGDVLLEKDDAVARRCLAESAGFVVEGGGTSADLRVVIFEGSSHETSDTADMVEANVGLVLGWHYLVEQGVHWLMVSCRSRGGFACDLFAQAHGGNGHSGSAGFRVRPTVENPYYQLRDIIHVYVRGFSCAG